MLLRLILPSTWSYVLTSSEYTWNKTYTIFRIKVRLQQHARLISMVRTILVIIYQSLEKSRHWKWWNTQQLTALETIIIVKILKQDFHSWIFHLWFQQNAAVSLWIIEKIWKIEPCKLLSRLKKIVEELIKLKIVYRVYFNYHIYYFNR